MERGPRTRGIGSYPFLTLLPPPRLFAHRGASGHRPENTLIAFHLALEMGAPYLELDLWMSRDGHLVILHDETVDRTTDGSGSVKEMSLQEIQELDAGYRFYSQEEDSYPFRGKGISIPTLEEVLMAFPQAMLNIEIKHDDPALDSALEEVLFHHGATDRVLLASESGSLLDRLRRRFEGRVATGTSREEGLSFARWMASGRKGRLDLAGQALQIPDRLSGRDYITGELVAAAHECGLEVHVWTVNEEERMRELLEMGVDGIMTDFPDRFPVPGRGK